MFCLHMWQVHTKNEHSKSISGFLTCIQSHPQWTWQKQNHCLKSRCSRNSDHTQQRNNFISTVVSDPHWYEVVIKYFEVSNLYDIVILHCHAVRVDKSLCCMHYDISTLLLKWCHILLCISLWCHTDVSVNMCCHIYLLMTSHWCWWHFLTICYCWCHYHVVHTWDWIVHFGKSGTNGWIKLYYYIYFFKLLFYYFSQFYNLSQ